MAKQLSREDLEAELRVLRRQAKPHIWATVVRDGIRWTALVAIAFFGFLSIQSLSGQSTEANILVKFFGDVRISDSLAWLLAGGGVVYGERQRALRRRTTKELQGRVIELEENYDPQRTSSQLTETGQTNPQDI